MADLGLDALEDWSAHIPRHIMQPYYKDVLPLLDGYLKNSTSTGTNRQKVVSLKGEENIFFFIVMPKDMDVAYFLSVLWAYCGWNNITSLTPQNLPLF